MRVAGDKFMQRIHLANSNIPEICIVDTVENLMKIAGSQGQMRSAAASMPMPSEGDMEKKVAAVAKDAEHGTDDINVDGEDVKVTFTETGLLKSASFSDSQMSGKLQMSDWNMSPPALSESAVCDEPHTIAETMGKIHQEVTHMMHLELVQNGLHLGGKVASLFQIAAVRGTPLSGMSATYAVAGFAVLAATLAVVFVARRSRGPAIEADGNDLAAVLELEEGEAVE